MNHKCPNCGKMLSLYWLFYAYREITCQCSNCKSIVEASGNRPRTDRIAFWVAVVCGYATAFLLSDIFDSKIIGIAAIVVCTGAVYCFLILVAPGINSIALLRNPE